MHKSEKELLEAYRQGAAGAFDRIFEAYRDMVFRVAFALTGERESALDVSQEVFLRLHKHLKRFRGESSLRTWIYRIALNRSLSQLRKRTFLPLPDLLAQRPASADPSRYAEQSEAARRLKDALSCLSSKQKQAFILKNQEGLRYSQVAEILKVSPGTVKAMIFQASAKLRKQLKNEEL